MAGISATLLSRQPSVISYCGAGAAAAESRSDQPHPVQLSVSAVLSPQRFDAQPGQAGSIARRSQASPTTTERMMEAVMARRGLECARALRLTGIFNPDASGAPPRSVRP